MVSSSCSTTSTVLPRSRRRLRVSSRRRLSRWCRPIDGSSKMYSTPTRLEPIWVASRMRCPSPPESVPAGGARARAAPPPPPGGRAGRRVEGRVVEPDVHEEAEPLADLLEDPAGDGGLALAEAERGEEAAGVLDGQLHDVGDRSAGDLEGERLRP